MRKIYSFLLLTLFLSIGTAWAADVTYDFTGSDWSVSDGTLTNGTVTFTGSGDANFKMNTGYFMMGKTGAYLNFPTYDSDVEKIVVTGRSGASASTVQNIFVGDDAVSTATTGVTGENIYLIDEEYREAGTQYTLKVTSNHNTQITKIEIFYAGAAGACSTPSISGTDQFFASTTVTLTCSTTGASIYYTLDGTTPSASSLPYSEPFEITATTTVKAIAIKDGLDDSEVEERVFTQATVMTVAEALAATADYPINNAYVSGIVCTAGSLSSGQITYFISDDGTETERLQVYKGKGLNNASFEAASDIQVGDIVTVYGQLKMYNNAPEFNSGNYLVAFERPASTDPSIVVSANEINAEYTSTDGFITVTYNNITEVAAEVYFFEADGTTPAEAPEWILAMIDEGNDLVYIIDENDGDARSAYLKVYALDDDANDVYSELITINQAQYVAPFEITDGVFDFNQNEDYGSELEKSGVKVQSSTWTAINVTMVMEGRNCWNDYSDQGQIRLYKASGNDPAGSITISAPEGYIITNVEFTGASFNKMGAVEGDYVVSNGNHNASWNGFANSVQFVATDRTDIYTIEVTYDASASITLGTNGYSTFAANFSYIVSGAEAYKARFEDDVIVLTQVDGVLAGEGIILKGEEGETATIIPSYEVAEDDFIDNELIGTLFNIQAAAGYYVLATIDQDGITKFHPCQEGIMIPANKAFMAMGGGDGAPIRIEFAENDATNINNVEDSETAVKFLENGQLRIKKNGVVYDITGATVR